MSQNKSAGGEGDVHDTGASGGARTGATDAGFARDTSRGLTTGSGGAGGGAATGATTGFLGQGGGYGGRDASSATSTTAKDYLSDKVSVAGEKLQDLRNVDYRQVAEEAKEYARQKPGQALLISAAAGFVLGILLRSRTSARPPGDPTTLPPRPRKQP